MAAREIIRVMPVELRIIKEELDPLAMALVGEHLERVFPVRSALNDVPVRNFGIEHRKAVVMAGGDGDVFHPGGFRESDPRLRVELLRVEEAGQALVFVY